MEKKKKKKKKIYYIKIERKEKSHLFIYLFLNVCVKNISKFSLSRQINKNKFFLLAVSHRLFRFIQKKKKKRRINLMKH